MYPSLSFLNQRQIIKITGTVLPGSCGRTYARLIITVRCWMNSLDLSKPCTESLIWHLLLDPLLCGTLIKLSPTGEQGIPYSICKWYRSRYHLGHVQWKLVYRFAKTKIKKEKKCITPQIKFSSVIRSLLFKLFFYKIVIFMITLKPHTFVSSLSTHIRKIGRNGDTMILIFKENKTKFFFFLLWL